MVVIVTTNVAPRIRGFLASCTLEICSGVYTAPHMTKSVRERIWLILSDWFDQTGGGSIVITWKDKQQSGGQGILTLGIPSILLVECNGIPLSFRESLSYSKS